jgi:hypothetical protein
VGDFLLAAAALACPVGMGLMMWFMMRGQHDTGTAAHDPDRDAEITALRSEIDQIKAERARRPSPTGER